MNVIGKQPLLVDWIFGIVRAVTRVKRTHGIHFRISQLEVKDVEVGLDTVRVG